MAGALVLQRLRYGTGFEMAETSVCQMLRYGLLSSDMWKFSVLADENIRNGQHHMKTPVESSRNYVNVNHIDVFILYTLAEIVNGTMSLKYYRR